MLFYTPVLYLLMLQHLNHVCPWTRHWQQIHCGHNITINIYKEQPFQYTKHLLITQQLLAANESTVNNG